MAKMKRKIKFQDYVRRTLQKWRLATIYPDLVFINTNADNIIRFATESNPFIRIKFSKYYIE